MECLFDEISCRNGYVNDSEDCKRLQCSHYKKLCALEEYLNQKKKDEEFTYDA